MRRAATQAMARPARPPAAGDEAALDQRAAHQAAAPGAERGANRQIPRAGQGPREEQPGDIGAHHQEDDDGRRQQQDQPGPRLTGDGRPQLAEQHAASLVGARVGGGEACGDGTEVRLRDGDGRVGPQSPDHVEILRPALGREIVGREGERNPGLGAERIADPGRQHADDVARDAVDDHGPSDDAGITARSGAARADRRSPRPARRR